MCMFFSILLIVAVFIGRRRNKAVADGAVASYLRGEVRSRVSKFAIGSLRSVDFDPRNADHAPRAKQAYTGNNGKLRLRGKFSIKIPLVR